MNDLYVIFLMYCCMSSVCLVLNLFELIIFKRPFNSKNNIQFAAVVKQNSKFKYDYDLKSLEWIYANKDLRDEILKPHTIRTTKIYTYAFSFENEWQMAAAFVKISLSFFDVYHPTKKKYSFVEYNMV